MGDLTRGELKVELKANLGNRDDLTNRMNRFLLLAERRIDDEYPWFDLVTRSIEPGLFTVNSAATAFNFIFPVGGEAFGGRSLPVDLDVPPNGTQVIPVTGANAWLAVGDYLYLQSPTNVGGSQYGPLTFTTAIAVGGPAITTQHPPAGGMLAGQRIYSYTSIRDILEMEFQEATDTASPCPLTYVAPYRWKEVTGIPTNRLGSVQAGIGPSYYTWEYVAFPNFNHSDRVKPAVFKLWPQPTENFYIRARYRKRVTPMASDSDYSEFVGKDYAIIAMASHIAFQSTGRLEDASRHFVVYRDIIDKAIANEPKKYDHKPLPSSAPSQYWADPFAKRSP